MKLTILICSILFLSTTSFASTFEIRATEVIDETDAITVLRPHTIIEEEVSNFSINLKTRSGLCELILNNEPVTIVSPGFSTHRTVYLDDDGSFDRQAEITQSLLFIKCLKD